MEFEHLKIKSGGTYLAVDGQEWRYLSSATREVFTNDKWVIKFSNWSVQSITEGKLWKLIVEAGLVDEASEVLIPTVKYGRCGKYWFCIQPFVDMIEESEYNGYLTDHEYSEFNRKLASLENKLGIEFQDVNTNIQVIGNGELILPDYGLVKPALVAQLE